MKYDYLEPHYLVVHEGGDWEIEHSDDCPIETHIYPAGLEGEDTLDVEEYRCMVGSWVTYWGIEDLKDQDPMRVQTPGRYRVAGFNYTPQSYFEDGETYIYFVEEEDGRETGTQ
jgi:hypothetical protein